MLTFIKYRHSLVFVGQTFTCASYNDGQNIHITKRQNLLLDFYWFISENAKENTVCSYRDGNMNVSKIILIYLYTVKAAIKQIHNEC